MTGWSDWPRMSKSPYEHVIRFSDVRQVYDELDRELEAMFPKTVYTGNRAERRRQASQARKDRP